MYERGHAHPSVGALSYTYGHTAAFTRTLLRSDTHTSHTPHSADSTDNSGTSARQRVRVPLVSVCDDTLLHGVYDQVCV